MLLGRTLSASLTVSDIQASLRWYRDTLGFSVAREFERDGALFAVSLKAGDARILITQDDGAKGKSRTRGEGFSMMIETDQNIEVLARRIKESGGTLDLEPTETPWGARMFRLRDPDGFKFTISSPQPR